MGIATLARSGDAAFLKSGLGEVNAAIEEAISKFSAQQPEATAPALARGLIATTRLLDILARSGLSDVSLFDFRQEVVS